MRNKTCVWVLCPAPGNTHSISAEELSVSRPFLLVLVSKGFLQPEGRNPALQTLARNSGRKIDHLFQERVSIMKLWLRSLQQSQPSYGHLAFFIHLRGRGFLHETVEKDPSGLPRGSSRYVEYLELQTS